MRTAIAALTLLLAGGLLACGGDEKGETPGLSMDRRDNLERQKPETAHRTPSSPNRAPTVSRVELLATAPLPGERIKVAVRATDPENDSVELVYRWRVNGKGIGDNAPAIMVPNVPKNSLIELEVVARDGTSESAPARASVRVGNQPPQILGASIEPAGQITAANPVSVRPKALDPDRDALSFRYTWRVNGRVVAEDAPVLSTDKFKRGDTVEFTVVASDGQADSEPLAAKPIRVANAAPHITSRPTGLNPDGVLRYKVVAEDADGDSRFRFRLADGPAGAAIDLFAGELTWTPIPSQAGKHSVEIEVDDMRGGKSSQTFELDVGFGGAPAAPKP
jgi:hypothetical protein